MDLESLRNIATVVAAIVALTAIYPLFRNLRSSERSLRFNVYIQVIEMLDEMRRARHLLYEKFPREPCDASLSQLSREEIDQLDDLLRTFDKLGLLVKHGVVPLEFVLDFYSYPIVVTWHRLKPYITAERLKRNQPGHMVKFEMLAIEAKKHRDKHHRGEETFPVTTEPETKWNVWPK
jgi:hypothetical protein